MLEIAAFIGIPILSGIASALVTRLTIRREFKKIEQRTEIALSEATEFKEKLNMAEAKLFDLQLAAKKTASEIAATQVKALEAAKAEERIRLEHTEQVMEPCEECKGLGRTSNKNGDGTKKCTWCDGQGARARRVYKS